MSLTLDDSAAASHPGGMSIEAERYLAYFGIKGLRALGYRLLLSLSRKFLHDFFRDNKVVFGWIRTCEHFESGCINPAIVLDRKRGLIATYTNLDKTRRRPVHAIKVTKDLLDLATGAVLNDGDRIATVSLYHYDMKDLESPAWADFDPLLPHCFTHDVAVCTRALGDTEAEDWDYLERGLQQLGYPQTPGLYYPFR